MKPSLAWLAAGLALVTLGTSCRSSDAEVELPFELELEFEQRGEELHDDATLEEVVREELARLEVEEPDKAAIDDAAFALELFYRRRGHAHALVDYEFSPPPPEPPRARFVVEPGPVVRVRELELEGVSEARLAEARAFFGDMAAGGVFDESRLDVALRELRDRYLALGHQRVSVGEPEVEYDEDGTSVAVRALVREGPVFLVESVEVRGGVAELAGREADLARGVAPEGRLYQPVQAPQLEHALSEAYQRSGYADVLVNVRAELDEESGAVRIVAEVTPGERVRIAHFRLVGNVRTRDSAVLGLMHIELGETYDSERIREAFGDLYATGLFEAVDLRLEGSGPERTLVVDVVEARFVQIRIEPGWGSYEGPRILLGIEDNNFQGRGQVVSVEGTLSLRAQGARIAWIDRDFLGTRFTSETTFFAEQREEPSFDFQRRGFGFFVSREWKEEWRTTFGYEFRPTDVTDDDIPTLPTDIDSTSQVAALSTTLALDDRDNLLVPTRGRQGRVRFEWADDTFGSDTEFLRAQLEYAHLFRLGEETVVAASGRTGVISPFGETAEIPLPERFFNGGESTVRSFEEDELLPEGATGEPVGGETATTLNLELRRAIAGNLAGALFADTGNVGQVVQDYFDFAGFRSAVGVGVRYLLPIGPVRLDVGVNPNPREDEDEVVLHFSVGFPF